MKTGNIDISLIENHITSKTKAIAIVHYLGVAVDMIQINKIEKIQSFCRRRLKALALELI